MLFAYYLLWDNISALMIFCAASATRAKSNIYSRKTGWLYELLRHLCSQGSYYWWCFTTLIMALRDLLRSLYRRLAGSSTTRFTPLSGCHRATKFRPLLIQAEEIRCCVSRTIRRQPATKHSHWRLLTIICNDAALRFEGITMPRFHLISLRGLIFYAGRDILLMAFITGRCAASHPCPHLFPAPLSNAWRLQYPASANAYLILIKRYDTT